MSEARFAELVENLGLTSLALRQDERLILRLASHGLTQDQTGEVLHYSRDTVKDRLEDIRIKLRAKNTTHAVATALRAGLIP